MTPSAIESSIALGYTIEVVWSENGHPRLEKGSAFTSIADFERVLSEALCDAPDAGYHKVKWVLASTDGRLRYTGEVVLSRGDKCVDVTKHIIDHCTEVTGTPALFGEDRAYTARCMHFMALCLRLEVVRARTAELDAQAAAAREAVARARQRVAQEQSVYVLACALIRPEHAAASAKA